MKKVITYGTFDMFHVGHYNLLKRAKELGDYLIVGVTTDNFDYERGKLNVRDSLMERIKAVEATGFVDQIVIEEYVGQKIDDIQKYGVDIFAIGSDWVGKFDYLNEYCKVVYLPRTEGISSTQLRTETQNVIRIGVIGTGSIAQRFVDESKYVSGVDISIVFNPDREEAEKFAKRNGIKEFASEITAMTDKIDACYIASPHLTHYGYAKFMLENGKHVLNETPFVLEKQQSEELFAMAKSKNLVLMDAIKTAYCPAFRHMITLLKSGVIGDIVDIETSSSTLTLSGRKLDPTMAGGCMSEDGDFALLPILMLLGVDYNDIQFYSKYDHGVDVYTKCIISYPHATASFKVGIGFKTEGNMIISGTKGYIYVPAPWWKTDYFEVRYEDQNKNKKYFYAYEGEGLRYELKEFVSNIINGIQSNCRIAEHLTIKMAAIQDEFHKNQRVITI